MICWSIVKSEALKIEDRKSAVQAKMATWRIINDKAMADESIFHILGPP